MITTEAADSLHAFVTITGEQKPADVEVAVIAHCRAILVDVAVPTRVCVLDEMPVTTTGKIDRQTLRKHDVIAPSSASPSSDGTGVDANDAIHAIEDFLVAHLRTSAVQLRALPELRHHPGFNSLIAAQCIESVEDRLGRSADYDKFTSRSFATIASIGALFDDQH